MTLTRRRAPVPLPSAVTRVNCRRSNLELAAIYLISTSHSISRLPRACSVNVLPVLCVLACAYRSSRVQLSDVFGEAKSELIPQTRLIFALLRERGIRSGSKR